MPDDIGGDDVSDAGGPGDVGRSSFPDRYTRFFQRGPRTWNRAIGGAIGPGPLAPPQVRRGAGGDSYGAGQIGGQRRGGDSYGAGVIGGPSRASNPMQETASVTQVEADPPKLSSDFPPAPAMMRRLDVAEPGLIKRFYVISGTDLEEMVGFPFHGVRVDNLTPQWLYVAAAQQYVPPNTHGAQFQIFDASNKAWFKWQAPIGFTQPAAGATGVTAIVYVTENILAPASGIDLSGLVAGSPDTKINVDQIGGTAVDAAAGLQNFNVKQIGASAIDAVTPAGTMPVMGPGTDVDNSSGNVSNAAAVATLPGAAGKTTYITGFEVTATGSTAVLIVLVTVTGILGGTKTYIFVFPAGVTTPATPLTVEFARPIPASATNTAIVVTLPAGGAGNTNAAVTAHGFQK